MMDNVMYTNEEVKQELVENPDFAGGWTGDDFECAFYGVERDLEARELTMLLQDSDGRDETVYIILMPSAELRHYDAWIPFSTNVLALPYIYSMYSGPDP